MGSNLARVIVCERTGHWATALRCHLADVGVRVWETRSLQDCWEQLEEAPASFVLIELTLETVDELLDRLGRLRREFPQERSAVVASRSLASYEWLAREAGAVHFTCSPRQLATVAQMVCRHMANVPGPKESLSQRIWSALPWSPAAKES